MVPRNPCFPLMGQVNKKEEQSMDGYAENKLNASASIFT